MDKVEEILNSPDAMDKVINLAKSLANDSSTNSESSPRSDDLMGMLSNVDPKILQTVMGVMREYNNTDDRRFHLLNALRPYMKSGDATHIDKAMQIMRISRVIKRAFGGGESV